MQTALTGLGCALIGILVGHYLSRSWQREQWRRDKRYEDYQAVLSAITAAYMAIVRVDQASTTSHYTPEMTAEMEVIKVESFKVIRDRIFIADELENASIIMEWDEAVTYYDMHAINERKFAERYSKLNDRLIRMALNPPRLPGRFRRWRMKREYKKFRVQNPL